MTEYQTQEMRRKRNIASINVAPTRGNILLKGETVFVFQKGRDLELYVEEFLDICHLAICDDICLMEGFLCGLDKDLRFVMPRGDCCWTLEAYINFAVWTNGSVFTVGKAEEDIHRVHRACNDSAYKRPGAEAT
ncbi:hypothetical protein M9458_042207, partial [Cirrhinus mrigala]